MRRSARTAEQRIEVDVRLIMLNHVECPQVILHAHLARETLQLLHGLQRVAETIGTWLSTLNILHRDLYHLTPLNVDGNPHDVDTAD